MALQIKRIVYTDKTSIKIKKAISPKPFNFFCERFGGLPSPLPIEINITPFPSQGYTPPTPFYIEVLQSQGTNVRKVISEVHFLYCSVLSLRGNVNTRRMLQPDMESIFQIKIKSMKYSGHRKQLCELSKLSNLVLLTSSDTKRTLMHLFTKSAQRELVSICTQSIYTTAIKFPCITPLVQCIIYFCTL